MLGKCKLPHKADDLFQAMIDEGCVVNHEAYTALLSAYSRSGLFDKAFSLLQKMKNTPDSQPDVHTYSIFIKSCLQDFAFDKVQALLSDMETQGIKPNTVTYNTLIDAYGKARKYVFSIFLLTHFMNFACSIWLPRKQGNKFKYTIIWTSRKTARGPNIEKLKLSLFTFQ